MFSNLTRPARVAAILLGQFGKTTKVVVEVTGHKITVRRCWDNRVIVHVYMYDGQLNIANVADAQGNVLELFDGAEPTNGTLAHFIMNRNTWPRAGKNERSWSKPSYKEVEAY